MAQNVKELKLISLLKSKVRLVFFKEEEEKNQLDFVLVSILYL